jgi:sorbitol-specific phosphotransferase system component IIC
MKLIVPIIFVLSVVMIFIYMIFELRKQKRIEKINQQKEEEQRFLIEKRIMRDVTFCEEYWLKNGSFNREQYVKYLEAKEEIKN